MLTNKKIQFGSFYNGAIALLLSWQDIRTPMLNSYQTMMINFCDNLKSVSHLIGTTVCC